MEGNQPNIVFESGSLGSTKAYSSGDPFTKVEQPKAKPFQKLFLFLKKYRIAIIAVLALIAFALIGIFVIAPVVRNRASEKQAEELAERSRSIIEISIHSQDLFNTEGYDSAIRYYDEVMEEENDTERRYDILISKIAFARDCRYYEEALALAVSEGDEADMTSDQLYQYYVILSYTAYQLARPELGADYARKASDILDKTTFSEGYGG